MVFTSCGEGRVGLLLLRNNRTGQSGIDSGRLRTTSLILWVHESRNAMNANPGLRPQPEDMLEDATQGGARAVRQGNVLGSLEVGKKADLLVLDTQPAHLVPAGRI